MYNPKIWYDGDIVTSGGLNNIEQGIAQNAHDIEDLSERVTNIENTDGIDQLKNTLKDISNGHIEFESGTYSDGDGVTKTTNISRIRNVYPLNVDNVTSMVVPSGYSAWIFRLDSNGTLISAVGTWKTGTVAMSDVVTSATKYINFAIKNNATPSSDISGSVDAVADTLYVVNKNNYAEYSELVRNVEVLNSVGTYVNDLEQGVRQFASDAKVYVGYYNSSGVLQGEGEEGITTGWGVYLVHVRKGTTVNISGCKNIGGTYSVWLNSANLSDVNSVGWYSDENNGSHLCVTDYLAISDNNTAMYHKTLSVKYDYDSDIFNTLDGEFDREYNGAIKSGNRFAHMTAFAKAGQTIRVRAERNSGTSTHLVIYYNNDQSKTLGQIHYGVDYDFVIDEDMTQLDAYLAGDNADSFVTVKAYVLGKTTVLRDKLRNDLSYCNIYSTTFTMASGNAHSSADDLIKADIPFGTLMYVYAVSSTGTIPAFMMNQYDENGTATPNGIISTGSVKNDGMFWETACDIDAKSLGFFVTAPSEETTITFYVAVKNDDVNHQQSYGAIQGDINLRYSAQKDILATLFKKPTFLVTCDIHAKLYLFKRVQEFYENSQSEYVYDKLLLGDLVADRFENTTNIMDMDFYKDTLFVLGNHDVWLTAGGTATAKQSYDKYIAPNVGSWGVVQPNGASANGYCYYYKDYPSAYGGSTDALRLIFLDEYHYDETQHNWFVSVLADAKTNNLSVVVCTHQTQCTSAELTALSADYPFACPVGGFNVEPKEAGYAGSYANAYINRRKAVDTFISNGGKFICWMSGHTHRDCCGTFTETNGKQLSLAFINTSQDTTTKAYINNLSSDSFQYVGFDLSLGYVYVVRIGQTVDKWLHQNQYLVYDYINHVVIAYK